MYRTGKRRFLHGQRKPYEQLTRADQLYVVLGVAVMHGQKHEMLKELHLAPASFYPDCDWCYGHIVRGTGEVEVRKEQRWAFHADCYERAKVEAPSTFALPPFTGWLTPRQHTRLCDRINETVGSVADLLSGDVPWAENELVGMFEDMEGSIEETELEMFRVRRRVKNRIAFNGLAAGTLG